MRGDPEREREEQIRWGRKLAAQERQAVKPQSRRRIPDSPQQPWRGETVEEKLTKVQETARAWLKKRKGIDGTR